MSREGFAKIGGTRPPMLMRRDLLKAGGLM